MQNLYQDNLDHPQLTIENLNFHKQLVDFLNLLGFKNFTDGVCNGFAMALLRYSKTNHHCYNLVSL